MVRFYRSRQVSKSDYGKNCYLIRASTFRWPIAMKDDFKTLRPLPQTSPDCEESERKNESDGLIENFTGSKDVDRIDLTRLEDQLDALETWISKKKASLYWADKINFFS